MLIPVLIAVTVAVVLITIILVSSSLKNKRTSTKSDRVASSVQKKGVTAVVKEYEKKLAHDPHNVEALQGLGDVYYNDQNWDKVWSVYKTLFDLSSAHTEIDVADVTRKWGIAGYYLKKYDEAINALMFSIKKKSDSFETNFYLGSTFVEKQTYDKAAYCFKKCKLLQPENTDVNKQLGLCLFKSQKYRDSLAYLKKAIDVEPENKELLYDMAVAMTETGMGDKALKIFVHLRPDPVFGAQSCLEAGKMHERTKDFQAAITDYEIAGKLENVPEQISLQIKYRCANCYIAANNIPKGLIILKQIQQLHPGYKDVDSLVSRYQELNQNQNLQVYLMSGTSDFVALCRKFITVFFKNAFVKIEDVSVASESIEIICDVESNKWEAKNLFRFYRNQNTIGDIYVREFHAKMRDARCDNGYCVTMGSFSESAHQYTEGRPIDLIEKDALCAALKKINMLG